MSSPYVRVNSTSSPPRTDGSDSNLSQVPSERSNEGSGSSFGRRTPASQANRNDLQSPGPNIAIHFPSVPGSDIDKEIIWGTTISVIDIQRKCKQFVHDFELEGTKLYYELLKESILSQLFNVNLDTRHVLTYEEDLYKQLIRYPQEVIPIFDQIFTELAREWFSTELNQVAQDIDSALDQQITVRPFNLREKQPLRNLEPKDIDQLVATSGMVIRVSPITPDMQTAFFKCSVCGHEAEVGIDSGRIDEPGSCQNQQCMIRNSYGLVYSRCFFSDRQLVKVQESPESIPEGETPHTIDVFVHDQMVDFCKPGDRVEVTGVYRCRSIRSNPRRSTVESVFSTFLDAVHIQKVKKNSFTIQNKDEQYSSFSQKHKTGKQLKDRNKKLEEMGRDPNIYERLAESFAPSIWEMQDVKKGILCQLFGATAKMFGEESSINNKFRNELNVLLCGDPGTAKSQLLQYVHKVAPRGIYTSGKGSSAVGLTAYITRDPETHDLVLESGALVLSDRGICCIDEFDKMSQAARSILHEVMEQQTVSIAKAGIICQLNARTSILAAANPIESRYNPKRPVTENIDLPPTLLSRFDLIYLVLDLPNKQLDRILAQHLVSLYYKEEDRQAKPTDFIDQKTFQEYVAYCREEYHPKLTDEAGEELVKAYTDMRNLGRNRGRKIITATPRNLESLIRLSEALARMKQKNVVSRADVKEAVRLQAVATHQAATDPRTGEIDMGMLTTGVGARERERYEVFRKLVDENLSKVHSRAMKASKLLEKVNENLPSDIDQFVFSELAEVINSLEKDDVVRCDNMQADDPVIKLLQV